MIRKFYAFLVLLTITIGQAAIAQSGAGELRGKVVDAKTKEGVPFAGVIVELNGTQIAALATVKGLLTELLLTLTDKPMSIQILHQV